MEEHGINSATLIVHSVKSRDSITWSQDSTALCNKYFSHMSVCSLYTVSPLASPHKVLPRGTMAPSQQQQQQQQHHLFIRVTPRSTARPSLIEHGLTTIQGV